MASNEKDSPISLLETLSEIDGNLEYFAVAKDGTTYKCTPAQLKDFVLKGETPVVRIPLAVLNLSNSSSSEDILNAFGGKETFIALCEKIYGRDVVCVCQGFASDDENMKTGYVTQAISCKHIDAENAILMFLINIDNVSHRLMINCVDGTASFSKTTVDDASVILLPDDVNSIEQNYSSKQIFDAFGGKETFIALCEKIYGRDVVCVCQGFASDDENMKTGYVTQAISCKHIDAENAILMFLINIDNVSHRLMINCVDGTASFSKTTVDDASVILLPDDVNSIEQNYSSKQIFDAFGGKDAYNGYVSKITQKSVIKIGDALYAVSQVLGSSYTDENNSQLVVQTIAMNVIKYIQVTVTGGTAKAIVGKWDVVDAEKILTKDNTTAYTPTNDYHPATKKYVDNINYGKVINVSVGTYLTTNKNERDREAIDLINTIFGSVDNLKEIIQDIIANHTKYYFHSYNSKDNCIELSSIYSFHNPETEEYNLQCNISYYTNNGPVSKRMGFKLMPNDEDCAASIEDILTSDNLQRVVKRTKSEYGSISAKDNSTMYAVTE